MLRALHQWLYIDQDLLEFFFLGLALDWHFLKDGHYAL